MIQWKAWVSQVVDTKSSPPKEHSSPSDTSHHRAQRDIEISAERMPKNQVKEVNQRFGKQLNELIED